jgi:uncharacterized protein YdeI (YjbR/CyaY-like superfamily)
MSQSDHRLPIVAFPNAAAFSAWIEQPGSASGLWVKFAKKTSGITSISKQEAIDVALCHGWIDGQMAKFDANHFLIRFTPRRARSKWSEVNRTRAMELMKEGRMTSAGLAEIERAKSGGRWDAAYPPPSRATMPDDLAAALEGNAAAKALFANLDGQNRFAILHRIQDAKKPETRAARIAKYVGMLAEGETPYPRRT